jgi:hypothetical protein
LQIDTGETGSLAYALFKESSTSTILPGDSILHTFNTTYIAPWNARYYVRANVWLECDSALVNNTIATEECVDLEDVYMVSIDHFLSSTDNIGNSIQVRATVGNHSDMNSHPSLNITVLVTNSQGVQTETFTETTGTIGTVSTASYTFTQSYTVPNDSVYYLTVYIDKYDNYSQNDTITIKRYTKDTIIIVPPGINSIKETKSFTLGQNIPNPANNSTLINYSVPEAGNVIFQVHSISGQLLYSKTIEAQRGNQSIELNTSTLAAGIYFYSMEYKGQRLVKRMSVQK